MADSDTSRPSNARLAEEARNWIVRLASGLADAGELERFRAWRAASPDHERAFARERALWQHLDVLAPAAGKPARPFLSRRALLAGGGAVAVAAAGAAFAPDIRLLWQADYRTAAGEQLSARLPDGSTALLNTDTALALDYGAGRRGVSLLRGEALFEVTDGAVPFRAAALGGGVEIGAGSFALRALGEEAGVRLAAGAATVASGSSPGPAGLVALRAGEETRYRDGEAPAPAAPFDADAELAWRSGRIIFDGKPFGAALAELGRYVPERLVLGRGTRAGDPVSAIVSIRQANEAIVGLARTQGLSVRRIPGIVIYIA